MLSEGRKLFEKCREDFASQTGQELYVEGWGGLSADERAAWDARAFEQEQKERQDACEQADL